MNQTQVFQVPPVPDWLSQPLDPSAGATSLLNLGAALVYVAVWSIAMAVLWWAIFRALWLRICPPRQQWAHKLRKAKVTIDHDYGPESSASPGMVRVTMRADGIVVYDFEMDPESFVDLAEGEREAAERIRRNMATAGPPPAHGSAAGWRRQHPFDGQFMPPQWRPRVR